MERKHQIIESLLAKPSKKPDFSQFKSSEILKKAQQFMPMFISTTDRLLSDPELLKSHQMDIQVVDNTMKEEQDNIQQEEEVKQPLQNEGDHKLIQMDIGVGVYDIHNDNYDEKNFKASSTEPVVRIQGMKQEDCDSSSSDGDGSDDSNLYYEFDSDDGDAASLTTKSTSTINKKQQPARAPPMIIDITPPSNTLMKDEEEVNQDASNNQQQLMQMQPANKKKRLNRQR